LKFAKSILTGAGAVVLAGLILALLAPKAAHAIVATAVQVENTVASPVVSQSILPGAPFSTSCVTATRSEMNLGTSCTLSPATPAGYTFHATYLSAVNAYSDSAPTKPDLLELTYLSNGNLINDFDSMAPAAFATIVSHPVDWYIDPGTNINVGIGDFLSFSDGSSIDQSGPPTFHIQLTVSGYLTH
jgi:hypothetical protein